jgi:hypothetical protein
MMVGCSRYHWTKPPSKLRQADPDPSLANIDTSSLAKSNLNSLQSAKAKHESPDADEAIPAAVLKLFSDTISSLIFATKDASALFFIFSTTVLILEVISAGFPFKTNEIPSWSGIKRTVVFELRAFFDRVMLNESLAGTICSVLDLPQYLINAMFIGDQQVTSIICNFNSSN